LANEKVAECSIYNAEEGLPEYNKEGCPLGKKPIHRLRLLTIAALIILLIAGCGQTRDNNQNNNAGGAGGEEKVTLTLNHFRVTDDAPDVLFREKIKQFKDEHPEVILKEDAVAHDPYRQKMTTLGASGSLPDIFMANGSMLLDFVPKGYVAEWDDILSQEQHKEWSGGFIEGAFDDFVINGKIYGAPIQVQSTHVVYYNQELFNQAGITEFPQEWDGFIDAIEKLKAAGLIPIASGNKPNWPFGSTVFSTLADRVTGTEWFLNLKEGKAKFTDPEFVDALTKTKQLADMGAFNKDMNSLDPDQGLALYLNKQAAMYISGAWTVTAISQNAPEDVQQNTRLALLPKIGKGEAHAVSGGGGWSYAINAKLSGKKKDLAIELIKKWTDADYSREVMEVNGMPPQKVETYDKSKLSALSVEYFELMDGVKYTPVYDIHLKPNLVETLYKGLQDLVIGQTTPEKLAQKLQDANR
jgi:raffinose/stachyose/melibiose transport system substrate-binding protein